MIVLEDKLVWGNKRKIWSPIYLWFLGFTVFIHLLFTYQFGDYYGIWSISFSIITYTVGLLFCIYVFYDMNIKIRFYENSWSYHSSVLRNYSDIKRWWLTGSSVYLLYRDEKSGKLDIVRFYRENIRKEIVSVLHDKVPYALVNERGF